MKCHYNVLGISLQATSDEIKKAYRKLALECHPDKNLHRLDEATEAFQLLQQAYEILIDPQERAWYDRHRDEILKGGYGNDYKDNSLDIYQYYNASCFKGYSDNDKGFYTVFRDVFNKITAEDEPFMDGKNVKVPQFGYSYSSYEDIVHNFYAHWQSYCTAKSFSWVDKYDLAEHRKANAGRPVLRIMEKENKKLRDQHKKIRNEEIRQLVCFVRKRDKRVQAHKKWLEEQNTEKAKKVQEQRTKQKQERIRKLQSYQESEWSSMSQLENHISEIEANLDNMFGTDTADIIGEDENGEQEVLDLYCVACDKDFRSTKSMMNHENSKKHKENVVILKKLMQEEELDNQNKLLGEEKDALDIGFSENDSYPEDLSDINELLENPKKSKKKKKKRKVLVHSDNSEQDVSGDDLNKSEVPQDKTSASSESVDSLLNMEPSTVVDVEPSAVVEAEPSEVVEPAEAVEPSTVEAVEPSKIVDAESKQSAVNKKCEKSKNTKIKKKVEATDADTLEQFEQLSTACEKCGSIFISRNKLFEHLKKTGHALYLGDNTSESTKDTSRKSKKSKKRK